MQNLEKMRKIIDELPVWEIWRVEFNFRKTCSLFPGKTPWKPDGETIIKKTWWVVLELGSQERGWKNTVEVLVRLPLGAAFRNNSSEPEPKTSR